MTPNPDSLSPPAETKRIYLETLGCAKNRVDSEIMLASLKNHGFELTMDPKVAEVIIVNTCAFLTVASEESINRILDLSDFKSSGNCEKLVATGCLTQRYQDSLSKQIPELDGMLGSNGFEQIPELVHSMYEGSGHSQVSLHKKPHYKQFEEQARIQTTPQHFVYLKIAEGCSNMCSFCNIPSLRGNFSSRSVNSIVTEIRSLTEKGVKEINLISQDTSSYAKDFKNNTGLATLLKSISKIEGDFWIRLFYCYPNTFTTEALEIIAGDTRFCRYLDMPFQHINDDVLKAMNRKIDRAQIEIRCRKSNHIFQTQLGVPPSLLDFRLKLKRILRNCLNLFQQDIFNMLEFFHIPMKITSAPQNGVILFQMHLNMSVETNSWRHNNKSAARGIKTT